MIVSHIVAASKNWVIGLDGKMPWNLRADLQYFKDTTMGWPMIMGRKTFESLGRVLPGRLHIVLSRSNLSLPEGCKLAPSLNVALQLAQDWLKKNRSDVDQRDWKVFIIGGGDIYNTTRAAVQRIYLTKINRIVDGDTYYPPIDLNEFKLVSTKEFSDPEDFSFQVFDKIN
jgi:dihydrofolate reductase